MNKDQKEFRKLAREAVKLYRAEKWIASIAKWDEIISLLQDDLIKASAYTRRGYAKDGNGDHKDAIADFDRAIEINPQFAKAYGNRGIAKSKMDDNEDALADYVRAIEINPQYAKAYSNRGVVKHNMGDHEGALADYDRAIEISPQFEGAYYNRGVVKNIMGDYEDAIADFDRAIEINPKDAVVYSTRSNTKNNMGDYEDAIADCDRALKIDPTLESASYNRAVALAMRKSQKGRDKIEEKYQAQLRAQQKKFDRKMQEQAKFQQEQFDRKMQEREQALQENLDARFAEAFDSGKSALKSSEYKKRLCVYNILFWLHGILVLIAALWLAVAAFIVFSALTVFGIQMWQGAQSPMAMSSFSALSLFPFVLMGTLVLTPFAWIVRMLNRDKHKYWVLREDALANLTLMQIIESNLKWDIKRELWLQLFDHHDKRGSAHLIADWNRAETDSSNNPGGVVRDIVNRFSPGDNS